MADQATNSYVVDQVVNYGNTGVGSLLSPRQRGSAGVPVISRLRIIQTQNYIGTTQFTLAWNNVSAGASTSVDHYNIYYTLASNTNFSNANQSSPVGPFTATGSPAVITVQTSAVTPVIITVQTVLSNGSVSPLASSPTVSGSTAAPTITGVPIDGSDIIPGTIDMLAFATGIRPPVIVTSLPTLPDPAWPAGATVVLSTDPQYRIYRSTGSTWIKTLDGGDIIANTVTTGALAAGSVTTTVLAAAAVDATKIDILQILVNGLTLTNNSPSAGDVAWSSSVVYYNGTAYSISSGNTADKFITWTVGAGSFTASNSFAPASNVFLIATNTTGTADVAWSKIAASSIQKTNLSFGLLTGQAIQPLATVTNITQVLAAGNHDTLLLSTTGDGTHLGGGLLAISVRTHTGAFSNVQTGSFVYQIDGQPAVAFGVMQPNNSGFFTDTLATATNATGPGSSVGDTLVYYPTIAFSNNLDVWWRWASGGTFADTLSVDVSVMYSWSTS